jgi:AAA15 family ATPase/GTPase
MAPLTGIFGPNSSGKTAILQFLLMLKQTVESSDRNLVLNLGNERTYANLGTSYDILHQHQLPGNIRFSLSWEINESILGMMDDYKLNFTSNIKFDVDQINVEEFSYQFQEDEDETENKIGVRINRDGIRESKYTIFEDFPDFGEYDSKRDLLNFNYVDGESKEIIYSELVKSYGFPINAFSIRSLETGEGFYHGLVLEFESLFSKIHYLGPLREYPQRSYLWSGERPQDVGKKGEFIASALLASRKQGLKVEERVAYWLKQLGLIHDFQVKPIAENRQYYEIRVRRFANSSEVLITDVGFGVSQILPVLVLCYYVPEGSIVILEQPEIHLHPSVQAGLADVFIDVIKNRNVQIILESHSEHLLRRLQRRIAEEHHHMTAEDAALYFCSIDDTGTSKLTSLDLDAYGNINNWPQGFFGDEMGDLVAMTEAAVRRQTAKS